MLPAAMSSPLLDWLLECAPFGVAWYPGDGRIRLNAEAARIAGLSERELPLDAFGGAVRLLDACARELDDSERPLFVAMEGRRFARTRMEVARADGTRIAVAVEALPWPVEGRPGAVVIVEDVEWSLESERRQSEWLGALGHELNGALQNLVATVAAAERWVGADPQRVLGHLANTRQQAASMGRLVRDFLDAAKLGAGTLQCRTEPVPLELFLRASAERAQLSDGKHRVELRAESELWAVVDLDRLSQILTNLFSNAARYAAPGVLELGARLEGDRVLLWLRDEGPGIPEELQGVLFQRYRRLPSRVNGAGLGLWLSRELAQVMGGDLWVKSRAGESTTFFVSLPAALSEEIEAPQGSETNRVVASAAPVPGVRDERPSPEQATGQTMIGPPPT